MHIITKIWVLASLKQYEITSKDHTKSCQSAKKIQVKLGFLVSSSLIFFAKNELLKQWEQDFLFLNSVFHEVVIDRMVYETTFG